MIINIFLFAVIFLPTMVLLFPIEIYIKKIIGKNIHKKCLILPAFLVFPLMLIKINDLKTIGALLISVVITLLVMRTLHVRTKKIFLFGILAMNFAFISAQFQDESSAEIYVQISMLSISVGIVKELFYEKIFE